MILLPCCYRKNRILDKYGILKKYVFNKICVKEIISKSNELEKLKLFILDNTSRNKYDKIETFLPRKYSNSIWEVREREEILEQNN